MTIIEFPGNFGGGDGPLIERAVELKQELVRFVLEGPMRDAFEQERRHFGLTGARDAALIGLADWFIFDWEGDDGARVLDEFLALNAELSDDDRGILEGWYDAINDVFEIADRRGNAFVLRDADGAEYTAIPTVTSASALPWQPGTYVSTRLVPVGAVYLFSGTQTIGADPAGLADEADEADEADDLEQDDVSDALGVLWRVLAGAFQAFFGTREVIIRAGDLGERLDAFHRFAFDEYVPEGLDRPLGALLEEAAGAVPSLDLLRPDLPADVVGEEIGLLADPDEGLAIVPGYGELRRHVAEGTGDPAELRDLVLNLLEEQSIPPFVFRVLAELPGSRLGALLAAALGDPEFDVDRDLEALLEEFKPLQGDDDPFDDLDGELLSPEDIFDVRDLSPQEAPPGSVVEAARVFAHKLAGALKPATLEKHIGGMSLFAHYAGEEGLTLEQLNGQILRHFLGVWYARHWADRSTEDIKNLLATIEKFTAWLDKSRRTNVGAEFKKRVLPTLKPDLLRVMGAIDRMDEVQRTQTGSDLSADDFLRDPTEILRTSIGEGGADDIRVGEFAIVAIDGTALRVDERPGEEPDRVGPPGEPVSEIEVPPEVAGLLGPGDVLEAELLRENDRWRVRDLIGLYPASAF